MLAVNPKDDSMDNPWTQHLSDQGEISKGLYKYLATVFYDLILGFSSLLVSIPVNKSVYMLNYLFLVYIQY